MSEISFINLKASELLLDDKEICRYLNMSFCDKEFYSLINDCKKEVAAVASPKAVYCHLSVTMENDILCLGFGEIYSKNLSKNLSSRIRSIICL